MQRWNTAVMVVIVAFIFVGCGSEPQVTVEEAYGEFRDAIREVENPGEKTALCEDFLNRFPTSEHTGSLAGAVAYYRGSAMEDPAGAIAFLDGILAQNDDADTRFDIQLAQFPLAMEIGQSMDLEAIVTELEAHRSLTFGERLEVGEIAAEHELWAVAEAQAAQAAALATPEAYKADYPDTDLTDDVISAKADARKVMAAANHGWALAHLDRAPEALAVFEAAEPLSQTNYLGVPSTDLFAYWGRTVLAQGDDEKAMELLGPTAVLGDNDEAFDAFKEAYISVHQNEAGFEEFLWSQRQKLARFVDTFELPDYQGTLHNLADTKGKVVFLSFWFPT